MRVGREGREKGKGREDREGDGQGKTRREGEFENPQESWQIAAPALVVVWIDLPPCPGAVTLFCFLIRVPKRS
jgi:hypothetical protein